MLLQKDPPALGLARQVRAVLLAVIVVSIVALILETVPTYQQPAARTFRIIEIITIATFTAEYLLRLWVITEDPRYAHPVRGRIRWALTPLALMDLLAFVPFYLPFIVADTRVLRLARLFRLARILRLGRYNRAATALVQAAHERREELVLSFASIIALMLISSSLMYYAEREAQPEVFSSIPDAMWWAVVTLTTVGYGDAYPITTLGRLLASATAVLGVAMLALPTAILTAAFLNRMERSRRAIDAPRHCPHCGGDL
jgi:voltage-gated potassium channel